MMARLRRFMAIRRVGAHKTDALRNQARATRARSARNIVTNSSSAMRGMDRRESVGWAARAVYARLRRVMGAGHNVDSDKCLCAAPCPRVDAEDEPSQHARPRRIQAAGIEAGFLVYAPLPTLR